MQTDVQPLSVNSEQIIEYLNEFNDRRILRHYSLDFAIGFSTSSLYLHNDCVGITNNDVSES